MNTKFFSILVACLIVTSVFSQANLNDYKYVIVPTKYDFLKGKDQYQLNSFTAFLFNKYGFQTLMEGDEYPEDLVRNRCLALRSDVTKESGMFKTKLLLELKSCNDQVVFTTKMGESREKEYQRAYTEAMRNAFKSFEDVNYKYEPKVDDIVVETPKVEVKPEVSEEIKKLKEEIKTLKNEKKVEVVEVEKPKVVEAPVVIPEPKPVKKVEAVVEEIVLDILYAQEIDNGFQLVDSTPKVVYKIKKTGQTNLFLVENENAIIYKIGDTWVYEYSTDEGVKQKELNIKF